MSPPSDNIVKAAYWGSTLSWIIPLIFFLIFTVIASIFTYKSRKEQEAAFNAGTTASSSTFKYKMPTWIIIMWILAGISLFVLTIAVAIAIVSVARGKAKTEETIRMGLNIAQQRLSNVLPPKSGGTPPVGSMIQGSPNRG